MQAKIALVQMMVIPGNPERNLSHACELLKKAHEAGAEIAVLPEALDFGWIDPSALRGAGAIPGGREFEILRQSASDLGLMICAGLSERDGTHLYNTAILIDRNGELLVKHRKLNELEIAHDIYSLGECLAVSETRYGRIGLMICADAFARGQVISRTLGYMGARLILSPCAWAVASDHDNFEEPYGQLWLDNYGPVAKEFQLSIVGVSNVGSITSGPWKGRKCIGCSLVVGPTGEKMIQAPYGETAETIEYVDLALKPAPTRGTGWERFIEPRPPHGCAA